MLSHIVVVQFAFAVVAVYRCTVQDVTVFSDRPCEPAAARYEPDTSRVSTYSPPPPGPAPPPLPEPRTRRGRASAAANADQVRHATDCERLRTSLKDIAARMRAGYNAKEGEQLRARKVKLEAQRRAKKCR
ncbi:MAG TPA: hypothetical protein VJ299_02000 [Steroidobacteraceae bacterium]|jgi:hypothetical protein|nr:hypothetical protein [Steroidobacteraceae bacterium]